MENNPLANPLVKFAPPVKPLTPHEFSQKFALIMPYVTLALIIYRIYSNHRFTTMLKKVEKKLD